MYVLIILTCFKVEYFLVAGLYGHQDQVFALNRKLRKFRNLFLLEMFDIDVETSLFYEKEVFHFIFVFKVTDWGCVFLSTFI